MPSKGYICPNQPDLKARKAAAVPAGVGSRGLYVAKAENAELWDVDGRRYIDFAAGIAVLNTGHRHPRVMEAVAQQALAFTHTCFHVAPYESYVRPGGTAECTGARRLREKDHVPEFRRGGGRERRQDCPLFHQALRSDRVSPAAFTAAHS